MSGVAARSRVGSTVGRPAVTQRSTRTSGPAMPLVLEKENAVAALREAIGATDPAEAAEGTVRKLYAESKGRNAIHASDSDENAANEIAFFFPDLAGK